MTLCRYFQVKHLTYQPKISYQMVDCQQTQTTLDLSENITCETKLIIACNSIHMAENLTLNLLNFLNEIFHFWNCPLSFLGKSRWKPESWSANNIGAWSDCRDVKAGLALYWWQRLITFGFSRKRVNNMH